MPAGAKLVGLVFGRLTVTQELASNHNGKLWLCVCVCGNTLKALSTKLRKSQLEQAA